MAEDEHGQFAEIEAAFNRAILTNDAARIAECMAEDWVLVAPETGPVSREAFLDAVATGRLSHATMTTDIVRVKVYDDMALVTGRGRNTGRFQGEPIEADEWVTNVYRRQEERWLCHLTQLSPVPR